MHALQLATASAGVDVVKVVERQPSLLLLDDSSPLADWSKLDQEQLKGLIQVNHYIHTPGAACGAGTARDTEPYCTAHPAGFHTLNTAETTHIYVCKIVCATCLLSAVCCTQLYQAWECGIASDSDPEWRKRADQLRAYHRQHGDTSVGWREGDDPELARWK